MSKYEIRVSGLEGYIDFALGTWLFLVAGTLHVHARDVAALGASNYLFLFDTL